ncbi:MAG: hypothetical protein GF329_14835 [Candidatus Lokiarchaeota archaeon]|nr:hypothetical protein [Candidatus Lokiarchaeota archaeon]
MNEEYNIPDFLRIERSVFEQFVDHTLRHSEFEWGGLIIGKQINEKLYGLAAVLPPQKTQSAGYCEFRRELFQVVYNTLEKVEELYGDNDFSIISWIHTHPGLSVFLSGTDQQTYEYLTKLNPSLTAIVVDPIQYDYLAVNSIPGNQNGFTNIDLDLNYLYDFNDDDQLIQKLNLIQESINSGINRRIFRLADSEDINVFIPIPFEELEHKLILSGLNGIKNQLVNLKNEIFPHNESKNKMRQFNQVNIIGDTEGSENKKLSKLIRYIKEFRNIDKEISSWKNLTVNKLLLSFDAQKQVYSNQIHDIERYMNTISRILNVIPVYQYNLYDKCFQYQNGKSSIKIDWDKIGEMKIDILSENNPFFVISFKKHFYSRSKNLLVFHHNIEELIEVLKQKVKVTLRINNKMRNKLIMRKRRNQAKRVELLRRREKLEREKEKKREKKREKERKRKRKKKKKEKKEKFKQKGPMEDSKDKNSNKKDQKNDLDSEKKTETEIKINEDSENGSIGVSDKKS